MAARDDVGSHYPEKLVIGAGITAEIPVLAGQNAALIKWASGGSLLIVGQSLPTGSTFINANHYGAFIFDTGGGIDGADAQGVLNMSPLAGGPVLLGGGTLSVECLINIPTISSGTQEYEILAGLGDSIPLIGTFADHANGVYAKYRRASSANWILTSFQGSVGSSMVSSIGVTTGWTKIRIDVNAAGTAATLSINGTAAGGLTTNIPVGASNIISPSISLRKTVGTNNAYMAVDYYRHGIRFTTAR